MKGRKKAKRKGKEVWEGKCGKSKIRFKKVREQLSTGT